MIERIRNFFHGRMATSASQGMAGAATVHVCVHPCPEHIALAVVFWVLGLVMSFRGGPDA